MFTFRRNLSITFFALLSLAGISPAVAQTGTVRGYPAGAALAQTPYYSAYYPVQYGYAYPPLAAGYAQGQTAYYAPAPAAAYAAARPAAHYTLSPSGGMSAGSEAYAYYGQSAPLNYVAPTYSGYQTRVVQVPVTYYRPYTVYQPGVAVPTTCQRAVVGATCQTQRHRWFSCLDWLFHRRPCGTPAAVPVAAVPAVAPRAVCYGNSCAPACGTPYYNTIPPASVVPVIPGTTVVPGATVVPGVTSPGIRGIIPSTTVPPPGTRTIVPGTFPGTTPGVTVPGGVRDGADVTPRLPPGTGVPPPSTFPGLGPSGASYRPDAQRRGTYQVNDAGGGSQSPYSGPTLTRPTISEPTLGPRRSVQPVPDPAAGQPRERSEPANRAPQLIAPNDRTAAVSPSLRGNGAWGAIPAKWPEKSSGLATEEARRSIQPVSRNVPALAEEVWDDTLWKSAAK